MLGVVAVGAIALVMISAIRKSNIGVGLAAPSIEGSTIDLGKKLFTDYALPFELISLVLLVAMIGAVLLSKKDLR